MDGDDVVTGTDTRRGFAKKFVAGLLGTLMGLLPLGAGLAVFLDPLRRRVSENGLVRVTTLEALPDDGVPRKFLVLATRVDAWNKFSQAPIGAVYLRRTRDAQIQDPGKFQPPSSGCLKRRDPFGNWSLELLWILELGAWSFYRERP